MSLPLPLLLPAVAVRTLIVLLALVVGIRIFGRRDLGGMNLVDLLLVLLLGNAVQNAMTYGSGDLGVGLVSAAILLIADRLLGILFVRQPWVERALLGGPTIVVDHGQLQTWAMRREGVSENEVLTAVRAMGLERLNQVRLAVLEQDGSISIVPEEEKK